MKILVCKTFGLGNALLTIPLLKALRLIPGVERIDVKVGNTHDDAGAAEVMRLVSISGYVDKVYVDPVIPDVTYDVAILAIPYDGRWQNGRDFLANRTVDGRTRPDPADTRWGFHTWKKHETEYMLENARALGYVGEDPDGTFKFGNTKIDRSAYIGMGYKKMPGNPWGIKHWGDDNYASLIERLASEGVVTYTTTTTTDLAMTIGPVRKKAPHLGFSVSPLDHSLNEVSRASVFVGNDTGMMHAAAAFRVPVVGLFFMENAVIKNPPWKTRNKCFDGSLDRSSVTVDAVFEATMEMIDEA